MLQEKEYTLKSNGPMLMHNGHPLNPITQAMKKLSAKRAKTEADYLELSRLEFLGGLYMGEEGPIIPAANIRGMLIRAARKRKEGKLAESGLFVLEHPYLEYDGPRHPDAMWEDGRFKHEALVVVSRSRIVRTRPIFNEWKLTIKLTYDDQVLNEQQLDEWINIAGHIIGLGDWRPQYGRFSVT